MQGACHAPSRHSRSSITLIMESSPASEGFARESIGKGLPPASRPAPGLNLEAVAGRGEIRPKGHDPVGVVQKDRLER